MFARGRPMCAPLALAFFMPARTRSRISSRSNSAKAVEFPGNIITGIGASPGRVAGAACVIHDPEEFDQTKPGDILMLADFRLPVIRPPSAAAAMKLPLRERAC
jgi:phosphoenolpyruvate synthase/pyruvate phosphate dikinase